jgi:phosphoribosylamine-glycine ligase
MPLPWRGSRRRQDIDIDQPARERIHVDADDCAGAVDAIDWPQGFCRSDIGWRAIEGA